MIMQGKEDILSLLRERGAQAARQAQRGVILQPGAIGDCILTLPLAEFMKEYLELGAVDILGHTEHIGILPGRSCVDGIRCIDSLGLHRLFVETKTFDLADGDPLINAFADYTWIATFLGEPNSNFEQNLIFTVNCSRSAEVITLSLQAPKGFRAHITDFYTRQLVEQSGLFLQPRPIRSKECLIKMTEADKKRGKELLKEIGLDRREKVVVIQPGSGGTKKCWHISNFLAVAKELISQGTEVIFLLGPAEMERFSDATIRSIKGVARCLTGLSLIQVAELLSCIDGFIGNDSGITHLAAASGVKTLAIFGPSNPAVYRPLGPDVTVFTSRTATFTKKPSSKVQQQLISVLLP
jgi:ADP-heptose:LPS heptosyltransferase